MYFLYNIFVVLLSWLIKPVALFHKKIKLFVDGRKATFSKLSAIKKTDKVIWFHCASLGEFEQGRPVIEKIKNTNPHVKIVLTFFSPSGYEVQKEYTFADVVCYLPLDTIKNAKRFLEITHPEIAIFVKYEFWPNILRELQRSNTKTILISGIFRKKQQFFKKGLLSGFMRNSLRAFTHFFVQNEASKSLLNQIDFKNVSVSGDTRFDRVFEITKQDNTLDFITKFKQNKHVLVAGSTWQKDEEILVDYINKVASKEEKFIIAPHNITDIERLQNSIHKTTTLFSDIKKNKNAQVFIVDIIGVLAKIYSYANIAYVGGGFGSGIHNILEPATFGVPIIIGTNYQKFQEAKDLIHLKACFVVSDKSELQILLKRFYADTNFRNKTAEISKNYIQSNIGATDYIIAYISQNSSILP